MHHHDENVAVLLQLDVAEEARAKQLSDGILGVGVVDAVPYFQRQVVEHRARRDALQAFYPDVLDHERLESPHSV